MSVLRSRSGSLIVGAAGSEGVIESSARFDEAAVPPPSARATHASLQCLWSRPGEATAS